MSASIYDHDPVDPSTYSLHPELTNVYKSSTGIEDDEQLKRHILKVYEEAYQAFPYPCIQYLTFINMPVTELPYYSEVVRVGQKRKDGVLLEIGPGLGSDIRKAIADGFPAENVIAIDLDSGLWDFGHRLFCSNLTNFPVRLLEGDIFDEKMLSTTSESESSSVRPELASLQALTPLKGHISVIIIQSVFHLFSEEMQFTLARRLGQLLSTAPGSLIIGRQTGIGSAQSVVINGRDHFTHDIKSWERMWGTVFPEGKVDYRTELRDLPEPFRSGTIKLGAPGKYLYWGIKRL